MSKFDVGVNMVSIIGEKTDLKTCFEARDDHFDCLDQFKDKIEDNHYRCPRTYSKWQKQCSAGLRLQQADLRYLQRRNEFLYTEEQLEQYNRHSNIRLPVEADVISTNY